MEWPSPRRWRAGSPSSARRLVRLAILVEGTAGIVVPPGDVQGFARALSSVLGDSGVRQRLAAGARHVRDRLPTWDDAANRMDAVLSRVLG